MGIDARIIFTVDYDNHINEKKAKELGRRLADAMGKDSASMHPDFPLIAECGDYTDKGIKIYQDGDPLIFPKSLQVLEVMVMERYYGPDYERGSWPILSAIIGWLFYNVQHQGIYYGGDSSGICFELMTQDWLRDMNKYWSENGRRPYVTVSLREKPLSLCPTCEWDLLDTGGGGAMTFYSCSSCSHKEIRSPTETRVLRHTDDFFTVSKKMRESEKESKS